MNKRMLLVFAALMMGLLSACGGRIPSAYRGEYVDPVSGSVLSLSKSSGSLSFVDRRIEAEANSLDFEKLLEFKPGIYTRINSDNDSVMGVYWIIPARSTIQEIQGFIWFEAEVIHTEMAVDEDKPVQRIQLSHSSKGVVMLDRELKEWQVGWPQGAAEYALIRKSE